MTETGTSTQQAPRFCPSCGTGLDGAPRFCPDCGANLQADGGASAPPPPPPAWGGQQGAWPAQQQTKTNGLAIASLVLGILWLYWIGSVLAVVFGFIARSQIDSSNGTQTGRGMATAGIVLGLLGVVLVPLAIVAITFLGESADEQFRQVGTEIGGVIVPLTGR